MAVALNRGLPELAGAAWRLCSQMLGLSDQVPARVEFLTDGTSCTVKAGPMQIVFKRTTPRQWLRRGETAAADLRMYINCYTMVQ